MWITWRHEDTDFTAPLTFDQKVDVFYEGTLGWQLHIADLIANGGTTFGDFKLGEAGYEVRSISHSGFARQKRFHPIPEDSRSLKAWTQ